MSILYNLGIHVMSLGAHVGALHSPKLKLMIEGHRDSIARILEARRKKAPQGFDIWFHAASLGEFEQARPIIEAYRKVRPDHTVLLTFFSPSGYTVRSNYPLADCVAYLPFDTPRAVCQFLDAARPRTAVFVKYEFWANFLGELHKRHVPCYLVSAIFRASQPFFKPWGGMFRAMLGDFTHIFVQDETSAQILATVGCTNVTVAGDTRFDRVHKIMTDAPGVPAIEKWLSADPDAFSMVVGSSWQPDEACYIPWLNAHPQCRAIVAPHEFDESRLKALRASITGKSVLWSQVKDSSEGIPADTQVLVIDCFGLLSSIYRYGKVAIIGGGLGAGIHNINEAAVYGIPVAFGPNHQKFREALDLLDRGGAATYQNRAQLEAILDRWLADSPAVSEAGRHCADYVRENLGATDTILNHLLNN